MVKLSRKAILCLASSLISANAFTSTRSSFVRNTGVFQAKSRLQGPSTLCMKTIAVVGASGLTAAECVFQALQNGDNVVGLTRYVRFHVLRRKWLLKNVK